MGKLVVFPMCFYHYFIFKRLSYILGFTIHKIVLAQD